MITFAMPQLQKESLVPKLHGLAQKKGDLAIESLKLKAVSQVVNELVPMPMPDANFLSRISPPSLLKRGVS